MSETEEQIETVSNSLWKSYI